MTNTVFLYTFSIETMSIVILNFHIESAHAFGDCLANAAHTKNTESLSLRVRTKWYTKLPSTLIKEPCSHIPRQLTL